MRSLLDAPAVYLLVVAWGGMPPSCAWTGHQNSPPSRTGSSGHHRRSKLARRQVLLRDTISQTVEGFEDLDTTVRFAERRGTGRNGNARVAGVTISTTTKRRPNKNMPERIRRPSRDDRARDDDASESKHSQSSREFWRSKFKRGDAANVSSSPTTRTHLGFNRELQHLVRNGKVLDGRTVAEQAEELLLVRMNDPDDFSSHDTVSFNIVLQAWANQRSMAAALRADNLLSVMLRTPGSGSLARTNETTARTTGGGPPRVRADAYSYAAVLNGYAKSGGKMKAALRATELLEQFERSSLSQVTSDVCHNAAMNAWAVSGSPQAGDRAERILRQLLGIQTVIPTRIAFNACIKAYAKAGQPTDAQRLLNQMKALSISHPHLTPDKITYSSCIDAWSRSSSSDDARQAERLLAEMEDAFAATGNANVQPDVVSYTSVLSAFAQSGTIHANKAHELMERMRRHAQDGPNAAFLNAWIHLLARTSTARNGGTATTGSQVHAAATAAGEILEYMQVEYAGGNANMKPCKITYTAVISVLAHVGTVEAARRAEALLDELHTTWERTMDDDYLPNAKTFASVLNAWAKSGSPNAGESAENLVRRMEHLYEMTKSADLEPSLVVFLQVFQVLANSRSNDAAEKAKHLLQKMHRLHLGGFHDVRPDATTYAYLINAFTKSRVGNVADLATIVLTEAEEGYRAGIGSLKPTALLYSAVLQAYAKCASPRGAELAEQLLERTKELYRQGKLYAKPTTLFYNAVIDAHARSGGGRAAAERAEALLAELESRARAGDESLRPTTRTYNAAILAWKSSGGGEPDAPIRAEALLRRMNEAHKGGDEGCRPDRVTLNSIIGVWAGSASENSAERAEQFLTFMERAAERGDVSLRPDAFTYNSCIAAHTRRNSPHQALRLYERMKARHEKSGGGGGENEYANDVARPDSITHTMIRRALASCRDALDPLEASRIESEISRFGEEAAALH